MMMFCGQDVSMCLIFYTHLNIRMYFGLFFFNWIEIYPNQHRQQEGWLQRWQKRSVQFPSVQSVSRLIHHIPTPGILSNHINHSTSSLALEALYPPVTITLWFKRAALRDDCLLRRHFVQQWVVCSLHNNTLWFWWRLFVCCFGDSRMIFTWEGFLHLSISCLMASRPQCWIRGHCWFHNLQQPVKPFEKQEFGNLWIWVLTSSPSVETNVAHAWCALAAARSGREPR